MVIIFLSLSLYIFFYLDFSFTWFSRIIGQQGKGETIFNSTLPLPPTSQIFTKWLGDFGTDLTPAHQQWYDSNRERKSLFPKISERKSLTTNLRHLTKFVPTYRLFYFFHIVKMITWKVTDESVDNLKDEIMLISSSMSGGNKGPTT